MSSVAEEKSRRPRNADCRPAIVTFLVYSYARISLISDAIRTDPTA